MVTDAVEMFKTTIDMMETSVKHQALVVTEMAGRLKKVEDTKLEAKLFWTNKHKVSMGLETVRKATADNFNTMMSTDNYVEKYLPIEIQQ